MAEEPAHLVLVFVPELPVQEVGVRVLRQRASPSGAWAPSGLGLPTAAELVCSGRSQLTVVDGMDFLALPC